MLKNKPNLLFLIAIRPHTRYVKTDVTFLKPFTTYLMLTFATIFPKLRSKMFFNKYLRCRTLYSKVDQQGLTYEFWKINDIRHRANAPAVIVTQDGQIIYKTWYKNGKIHRKNGPAVLGYDNGIICTEFWYKNGLLHRDDGPASIWLRDKRWFENGQFIKKEQKPKEIKAKKQKK
jgi:hypothetical protein